jgi:proteic killer suppression protein
MIVDFGSKTAGDIYHGIDSKEARQIPVTVWPVAQRKLDMVNSANVISDLRVPPGNRLEALKGERKGKFSIRINQQYRVIFEFREGNAYKVDMVDYH